MKKARVRLDRALSKLGIASRTAARALIAAGRVAVAGRIVLDPSAQIVPERADIVVDGERAIRKQWPTWAMA